MFDYAKIDLFSKLPKGEDKDALLEYLDKEFGVTAPRNYSFKRMVEVAAERLKEKRVEEEARKVLEEQKFQRTNITPHDLLRNDDTFKINQDDAYNDYGRATKDTDDGFVSPADLLKPAPVSECKLIKASIGHVPSQEFSVPGVDIIIPETFKPTFSLSMRTPDGRECTTIGYWVIDEIMKLGAMWKLGVLTSKYSNDLMSLMYYIQRNGYVIVRESRHSHYIILR